MRKILKYSILSVCFITVMMAVSFALPPGFLLPQPAAAEKTAEILSLSPIPDRDLCLMVFDFEGDRIEILDPLGSCTKYSVGDKVKV